jgi:S1-C subfamily serine protease
MRTWRTSKLTATLSRSITMRVASTTHEKELTIEGANPVGTATGFFYTRNDVLYLVTNRHVVIDEAKGLKPEALRLKLHSDQHDLTRNVEWNIPLYKNGKALWHVHQDYAHKPIDISVIEVDAKALIAAGAYIKALSSANFLPEDFLITTGEDVMVIGFPRGVSDSVHNLPLVRSALISSAFGVDFNGNPQFLVDANLHPGMSGSPVMTRPKNMWPDKLGGTKVLTGTPMYFLGIFSATLSVNLSSTQQEALGLGAVWYGRLIEEIIAAI